MADANRFHVVDFSFVIFVVVIVASCINGYLKSKIRILITHQINHVIKADRILILNNGGVVALGNYDQLLRSNIDLKDYLASQDEDVAAAAATEQQLNVSNAAAPVEARSFSKRASHASDMSLSNSFVNGSHVGMDAFNSKFNLDVSRIAACNLYYM